MLRSGTKCIVVLLLLASCDSRVRHANALIARGKLDEARELLAAADRDTPNDPKIRLPLAEIYLRQSHFNDAAATLAPLRQRKETVWQVAQVYRRGAHELELNGDADVMAKAATEAVLLDRYSAPDMCKTLLGRLRRERVGNWKAIIDAAATFSEDCKKNAVGLLRSWIRDPQTTADDIIKFATRAKELDSTASIDIARDLRAAANRAAVNDDRVHARQIMDATRWIDSSIMSERETAVLMHAIGPVEIPTPADEVEGVNYSGTRLDVTKRVLKDIGQYISMYYAKNGEYPVGSFGDIWEKCRPEGRIVQLWDGWMRPITYVSDGKRARLISGGADQKIDEHSKNFSVRGGILVDEAGADIIWEDGRIVQEPLEVAVKRISG